MSWRVGNAYLENVIRLRSIQFEIYEWKIKYGSPFVKFICRFIQFLIEKVQIKEIIWLSQVRDLTRQVCLTVS